MVHVSHKEIFERAFSLCVMNFCNPLFKSGLISGSISLSDFKID